MRRSMLRGCAALLSAVLMFFVGANCLHAQKITATLVGTVTDPQGAEVPNATVAAKDIDTGMTQTVKTNGQGEYRIEFLPVGHYAVTVNATGFKKFVQENIVLSVDQTQRVDAVLALGGSNETVTITAAPPLVNTSNAVIGRTVENKEIVTLPIVGRNVYSLLTLTPGVQQSTNTIALGFPQQQTFINGGSDNEVGSVTYYLDGGINMTFLRNTGNIVPNPDAVQEFRVETNNYSAEYGRFGSGVINIITRSGSNQFHGSLFEFYRTKGLNAAPWASISNPPLHRNQFGGAIGGPIRKDKTFFFGSYSGLRQTTSSVLNTGVVPTALERQGNFSQSGITPIDPKTGKPFAYNGVVGAIPPSRLDPTALALLNPPSGLLGIPAANLPGNVFQGVIASPYNTDEFLAKIDHALTQNQRLTVSYFETSGLNSKLAGGNLPWSIQQFNWRQQNANVSHTWTINANMVNQAWLTYTRNIGGRLNTPSNTLHDYGSDFQVQGFPSLPQIAVSGFFTLGQAIDGPTAGTNFYAIRDAVEMTRGRHSIAFGGEASLNKDILATSLNNYGIFNFTGVESTPKGAKGNYALADFMLGLPVTMNQDTPVTALDNTWSYGLFVQDDFRILPRLTLNLGLRYDLQTPPTDPQNRQGTFVAGATSKIIPSAPTGMLFPGDPGVTRGVIDLRKHHISPRVGLAWDPFGTGKTSIRAAGGVFYGSISGNEWNGMSNFQPFSVRQQFNTVASLTHPYADLPGGVSPFPYVYSPANPAFIYPAEIEGVDLHYQWPYTYQFNSSVQQQVGNDFTFMLSFVGAYSHNLPFAPDLNYPAYNSTATSKNVNNRRPIDPGTLAQVFLTSSRQTSSYNALQVTAEKRTSHNLSFRAFYTFSKNLSSLNVDDTTINGTAPQDYNALYEERGRTNFDIRNSFVASAVWDVSYFKGSNAILSKALNGWEISPIVTLHSGDPFNFTSGVDNNLDGNNTDRPNLVPGQIPTLNPHRGRFVVSNQWFNTAAFTANGPEKGSALAARMEIRRAIIWMLRVIAMLTWGSSAT